ncbi:MAG: PD40 domain-containing protein [Polyangiaceae bacterium]|nr:PD40 domain-containing protein [Polyangiaceae bacterium]
MRTLRGRRLVSFVVVGFAAAALVAGGCSADQGPEVAGPGAFGGFGGGDASASGGTGGGSSGTGGGAASGGTGGGLDLDSSTGELESLSISPPTAILEVVNGVGAPAQFTVTAHYAGGGAQPVQATFAFDRTDLALVSGAGVVTANGTKGGQGTLTATFEAMSVTAAITVKLVLESNDAGLDQAAKDAFATPGSTASGTLLYPYDQTVFGRGIPAPELMWDGGEAGATYRVSIADKYYSSVAWVTADPPSRYVLPAPWWNALAESSDGAPLTVTVQRRDPSGATHQPMSQSWKIAPGSLRGTIYYWAVNQGAIQKISPGATAPVPAFDPGPYDQLGAPAPVSGYDGRVPPWDDQGSGKRCVACHTVSKDGSRLAALFSACQPGQPCDRPWGIVDTASSQITALSNYSPGSAIYSALSPNGSHLVWDTQQFGMHLGDPATGLGLASGLDALTQVAHPQFSPDGKLLAFASGTAGPYPVEFSRADLSVMDVDLTTAPFFANQRQVLAGGTEAIAFPSFSPDSRFLVFQKGNYTRGSYGASFPFSTGYNDLFLVDAVAPQGATRLDRANGVGWLPAADASRNYQPRVNPVAVGGYFWVVFVSPRSYGNRMRSSTDATNENRKQLWVAAIDADPQPGTDPSHPAFWLPGQALESINMDGYWALEPCKQQGASCSDGYECCTGFCRDQGGGAFACVDPPTNDCSRVGETCATTADCCPRPGSNISCIGGVCALEGPA